ncbi:MAG: hypothetical protein HC893_11440 [Chloroflexaceae bacterium]|nr:hypothetical protein [Chloroflexaceae bacterium]NJL34360.1 hypothetical protein [Chloroflexaceae bacterium]NJO05449.1 hypothetical protein [Chloroflexaceae bacterium]
MKETPLVAVGIVLAAVLFGGVVGAFIIGTLLSFTPIGNGVLYGAIVGALVGGVTAGLQVARDNKREPDGQ